MNLITLNPKNPNSDRRERQKGKTERKEGQKKTT